MTNIIKTTLVEKLSTTTDKLQNLLSAEKEVIANRVKTAFKEAFDFLPIEVSMGYETVYFKVEGREILSINKRYAGECYLNTYATFIEGDFELKRLIFNGMIAKVVLENPNVYKEIFADTELKEEIAEVRKQLYALQREIKAIEDAEKAKAVEERLEQLKKGEEIEFEKLRTVDYKRGKNVRRVKAIKVAMTSKAKGTVTFRCENWEGETFHDFTIDDVNIERYILPHLN